jgi:hypothetical protein
VQKIAKVVAIFATMNSFTYTPYFAFHSSKCKKSHTTLVAHPQQIHCLSLCHLQNLLPFATFLGEYKPHNEKETT